MSRDVFYMVSSESDGRNDQQAAHSEPINNRSRDEASADTADHNQNIEQISGEENVSPFVKERVYLSAKDGLPIALTSTLAGVENEAIRNAYINQVSFYILFYHITSNRINFALQLIQTK